MQKKDDIKSAIAGLKKENDDLKMSLLKASVREKQFFFFFALLVFHGQCLSYRFSIVHIIGEL